MFTAPLLTVKLLALNDAMPLVAVVASLMVIDEPDPDALFKLSTPLKPLRLVTPPAPGQAWNEGAPAVDTRHSPEPPAETVLMAPVPCPMSNPFEVNELAPVPPLDTDKEVDNVRALNSGLLVVPMFWAVFTTPPRTEKLLALNDAIPFAVVDASSIVIVVPLPVVLLMFSTPVSPSTEVTPPAPGQAWKLGAPAVETKHWPALAALTVVKAALP